ncbi:MAG: hypothetical protein ACXWFQ_10225 [Thermoanaerobaculia bacterium]
MTRTRPLRAALSLGVEFTPLFVVNQSRVDLPGRPLGLAGPDNPGLSFYSGVVGLSWPAR